VSRQRVFQLLKILKIAWMWSIGMGVVILFLAVPALADNLERNWGIGIRGGAALLHQDIAADFSGTTGPIISGNILYHLTDILSVGFNVEWEKHNIEVGGEDMGHAKTLSLIPFLEVHPIKVGALSPYGFLGLGLNVNSFKRHIEETKGDRLLFRSFCSRVRDLIIEKKPGFPCPQRRPKVDVINLILGVAALEAGVLRLPIRYWLYSFATSGRLLAASD
jgi:hypothetical protein